MQSAGLSTVLNHATVWSLTACPLAKLFPFGEFYYVLDSLWIVETTGRNIAYK
jgi:hypothetical protein